MTVREILWRGSQRAWAWVIGDAFGSVDTNGRVRIWGRRTEESALQALDTVARGVFDEFEGFHYGRAFTIS
jgi:hypothetical protein